MNPLTNMKNQQKMNERELSLGLTGTSSSWHSQYDDSAWVFVGGLPYDLTEGDVICIFSQYGEIVNVNLVRDKDTGKSKGFAFICYEDQRSTILAVDNLNGAKVLNRAIRVDHKHNYQVPKERGDEDDLTKALREKGCAPPVVGKMEYDVLGNESADESEKQKKEKKKKKKAKKEKKKKSKKSQSPDLVEALHSKHRDLGQNTVDGNYHLHSDRSCSSDVKKELRTELEHHRIKQERRHSSSESDGFRNKRCKIESHSRRSSDNDSNLDERNLRVKRDLEHTDSTRSSRVKQDLVNSDTSRSVRPYDIDVRRSSSRNDDRSHGRHREAATSSRHDDSDSRYRHHEAMTNARHVREDDGSKERTYRRDGGTSDRRRGEEDTADKRRTGDDRTDWRRGRDEAASESRRSFDEDAGKRGGELGDRRHRETANRHRRDDSADRKRR